MQRVIRGPGGVTLTLDASEIIPHDPGAGTPALVEYRGHVGTYWCALGTGEVDEYTLTDTQYRWIETMEDTVNEFVANAGGNE